MLVQLFIPCLLYEFKLFNTLPSNYSTYNFFDVESMFVHARKNLYFNFDFVYKLYTCVNIHFGPTCRDDAITWKNTIC